MSQPDPLEPGAIEGQNPNTPQRLPGHTGYHQAREGKDQTSTAAYSRSLGVSQVAIAIVIAAVASVGTLILWLVAG